MTTPDIIAAKNIATQCGLELVETRRVPDSVTLLLKPATVHVFALRSIVDKHYETVVDDQWKRGYRDTPQAYFAKCHSVRAAMRLDTLRALLDSDEPIDLLGAMSAADAYALCERVSVRLPEKADEYKRAM